MGKYSIYQLPSDVLKITARNASELRKEKNLTQMDLAEKSGVSYGSIKRFEQSGKISFEALLKIAEALDRLDEFDALLFPRNEKRLNKLFESH